MGYRSAGPIVDATLDAVRDAVAASDGDDKVLTTIDTQLHRLTGRRR
jgi:hypothetical protein